MARAQVSAATPVLRMMVPMFYYRSTERSDVRMFTSDDGICWSQPPGGPVMTPGEPGAWNGEFILAGKELTPLPGSRIGVRYEGRPYPHKYPRWVEQRDDGGTCWAYWPHDRLCAVQAEHHGRFRTPPIPVTGSRLSVNVRTSRAGLVRVGLVDVAGRSIDECDPIVGDHPGAVVRWQGRSDTQVQADQPVALEFELQGAQVFGFAWT